MDREIGDVLDVAISMVTLAALTLAVLVMLFTGRQMAYNYLDSTTDLQVEIQDGELNYLKDNAMEMPSASVLALVKSNDNYINEVYLDYKNLYGQNIHGRLYDDAGKRTDVYSLFEKNVRAKVKLYITWNASMSGYDFYIHDIACTKDPIHIDACR